MSKTAAEASAAVAEHPTPATTNRFDSDDSPNDNTSDDDNDRDIRDDEDDDDYDNDVNKTEDGVENSISPKSQQKSAQQQARKRRKIIITTQRNEKDASDTIGPTGIDAEHTADSASESTTGKNEPNRPSTASTTSSTAPSKKQKLTAGSVMTEEAVNALMVPGVATKTTTVTSKGKKKTQIRYDPSVPMDKEQLAVWRREARRVRNRESAAASRQRIRSRITELEDEVSGWKDKYETALARLHELEQQQLTGSEASKPQQQLKQPVEDGTKPKSK